MSTPVALRFARLLSPAALMLLTMAGGAHPSVTPDRWRLTRERVLAVAEPAFRSWLASIPAERLRQYGLLSSEERDSARLLAAVPLYTPLRTGAAIDRAALESTLDELPSSWVALAAVGQRIACVVVVDAPGGEPAKAVEFGKGLAARRLDAGLRALKWPSDDFSWQELRLVSFLSPTIDLLLHRQPSGAWRWLNLTGTDTPKATELSEQDTRDLLRDLREVPPGPPW